MRCLVCRLWNRGLYLGVCGRASCLTAAKARADLGAVLVSDDGGLD